MAPRGTSLLHHTIIELVEFLIDQMSLYSMCSHTCCSPYNFSDCLLSWRARPQLQNKKPFNTFSSPLPVPTAIMDPFGDLLW